MNYHVRSTEPIEQQLKKSQALVQQLNTNCHEYREKIQDLIHRVERCETKALHFDVMMKAVNENGVVKSAWEKFMMALRMTGYDKSS